MYKERYGRNLNFSRFGFLSVAGLVCQLSGVRAAQAGYGDWRAWPATAPAPRPVPLPPRRLPPPAAPTDDALPGVAYEPDVFPADCMQLGEALGAAPLGDVRAGDLLEVMLGEVYSPSHFWMMRLGDEFDIALDAVMDEMTKYYSRGEGAGRRLAVGAVREGHCVASCYDGDWHRSVIVRIMDCDTVKVRYVDYGTVEACAVSGLRPLLRRWAALPAQALRARLAGAAGPPGRRRARAQPRVATPRRRRLPRRRARAPPRGARAQRATGGRDPRSTSNRHINGGGRVHPFGADPRGPRRALHHDPLQVGELPVPDVPRAGERAHAELDPRVNPRRRHAGLRGGVPAPRARRAALPLPLHLTPHLPVPQPLAAPSPSPPASPPHVQSAPLLPSMPAAPTPRLPRSANHLNCIPPQVNKSEANTNRHNMRTRAHRPQRTSFPPAPPMPLPPVFVGPFPPMYPAFPAPFPYPYPAPFPGQRAPYPPHMPHEPQVPPTPSGAVSIPASECEIFAEPRGPGGGAALHAGRDRPRHGRRRHRHDGGRRAAAQLHAQPGRGGVPLGGREPAQRRHGAVRGV